MLLRPLSPFTCRHFPPITLSPGSQGIKSEVNPFQEGDDACERHREVDQEAPLMFQLLVVQVLWWALTQNLVGNFVDNGPSLVPFFLCRCLFYLVRRYFEYTPHPDA